MKPHSRLVFFTFITLLVLVANLVMPTVALADDGVPPESTPAEAPPVETPPVDEAPPPEAPVSLPEVLEQAPPDTQVVVVNDEGQVEPLATVEAAEILATGDPVWCPDGYGPGDPECTGSHTSMFDLLDELSLDAGANYYGGGTIWIESTYDGSTDGGIYIDQADTSVYDLSYLNDLIFQGFQSAPTDPATPTITVPFYVNWLSNLTLSALNFAGAGASLQTLGNITVTDSTFNGSSGTGLMTDSIGTTTLTNVTASGNVNGTGVDVLSDGDVTLTNVTADNNNTGVIVDTTLGTGSVMVNGGEFNDNDYDGMIVLSTGNITVQNADFSNNISDGAYLDTTYGSGDIDVSNSTFDGNDYGLDVYSGGNITVDNATFSNNSWTGAYLDTTYGSGIGDIAVSNSTSTADDVYGLIAISGDGNATLTDLTVDGSGITDVGAAVASINGIVTVDGGTFTNTTEVGLLAVGGLQVDLVNVNVTLNAGDGAQVYSTLTYACFGDTGILVYVDGGTYTSNTGVPLTVKPGPDGTVTVVTAPTFSGNGGGDAMVVDLGNPCEGKEEEKPEEEGKPVNIVEVPFKDGAPVEQDCDIYSGTALVLPDGTWVKFGCPFDGSMTLEGLTEEELPGPLGVGLDFVSAITYGMTDLEGVEVLVNPDGTITLKFKIPADSDARGYDILYWDPSANNGAGAWVTLPQHKIHQKPVALNPDDPEDGRLITRGVKQVGDYVTVTVNFTGTFVLVAR